MGRTAALAVRPAKPGRCCWWRAQRESSFARPDSRGRLSPHELAGRASSKSQDPAIFCSFLQPFSGSQKIFVALFVPRTFRIAYWTV
jgi:hypothetical protein